MNYKIDYTPKALHEAFCYAQTYLPTTEQGMYYRCVLQELIDLMEQHRPLGPNGKHGNLHTESCGCEDI